MTNVRRLANVNHALAFQGSAFQIRKAERRKAKLRLALSGPSGSGKTLSALLIAYGITGDWAKIGLIDTENGRGELYAQSVKAGVQVGEYLYGRLLPPYSPDRYIAAIRAMEEAGAEVIVIDSLSHAWAGEGGVLDIQGQIADRTGNSFGAWRKASPLHNQLVDAVILSNRHIIATLRAKTEYVIEQNGKETKVRKVGLAPVQRDGLEYEFTVVLDLAHNHSAEASKDNTDLFDGKIFTPTVATGQAILEWLETGTAEIPPEASQPAPWERQPERRDQQMEQRTEQQTLDGQMPSVQDLMEIAKGKGIYLLRVAKELTGKERLGQLTPEDRQRIKEHLDTLEAANG